MMLIGYQLAVKKIKFSPIHANILAFPKTDRHHRETKGQVYRFKIFLDAIYGGEAESQIHGPTSICGPNIKFIEKINVNASIIVDETH